MKRIVNFTGKVLPLVVIVLSLAFVGCKSWPFIGDRTEFWDNEGASFSVEDCPANYRGNISSIVLWWIPEGATDVRKDALVVWKIAAEKPIAFSGFKFQVFVVPPDFKLVTEKTGALPKSGGYRLDVNGDSIYDTLLEDLLSAQTVSDWRRSSTR